MEDDQKLDRELGRTLSRMAGNRYDAAKDLYFETDPHTAAIRYPFDPRSIQVLGATEWEARFGGDD